VDEREKTYQDAENRRRERQERREEPTENDWADEAAKARTADDPRARTPHDAAGQPTTKSLEE
jgi:hypothetical protein